MTISIAINNYKWLNHYYWFLLLLLLLIFDIDFCHWYWFLPLILIFAIDIDIDFRKFAIRTNLKNYVAKQ